MDVIFATSAFFPLLPLRRRTLLPFCNSLSLPLSAMEGEPTAEHKYPPKELSGFPVPLSPPPPQFSKNLELERAMTASAKSGNDSDLVISRDDFIYEDEWSVVVNKPSGVYCESILSSVSLLLQSGPTFKSGTLELHLANRLDRDTSGIMVITKMHKAAGKLVKAYTEHRVKKTYVALCVGTAPKWSSITLKSGHGRSKFGAWRVYSVSDVGRSFPGGSLVKEMVTGFKVLRINGQLNPDVPVETEKSCRLDSRNLETEMLVVNDKESLKIRSDRDQNDDILIRAYPQSGRTHQIRLHCQWLGIPLRGDVKYGGVHEWNGSTYTAHALHAESLVFEHPITGIPIELHAPLPSWAV